MESWVDSITGSARNWRASSRPMWAFWFAALVMIAIGIYFRFRKLQHPAIADRNKEEVFTSDKRPIPNSPFFAYLGHNVLTEAVAQDPSNTSTHAIDRIPEHIKLRNTLFSHHEEEPWSYDSDPSTGLPTSGHWQSYSYPDSPHRQVSFDRIRTMRDEENDRSWQRRTLHVCGI